MDRLNLGFGEVASEPERELLRQLIASLRGLRYGSVTLVVHEGRLVEIQRTEKIRAGSSSVREGGSSSGGHGRG